MSDIQRSDKLAVMGLRVILKIYEAHPSITRVEAKDAFPKSEFKPYNIITDEGGSIREPSDDDLRLADVLLSRLLVEGVITGQGTTTSVTGAAIPPHIRRCLTVKEGATSNTADRLRDELAALDAGEERPAGTFTQYAQDIGFQP